MKDKILEWINFFVGVVFVLLIYVFRNNLFNVVAVASIGALVYGAISIIRNERYGYPLTSFGISIGVALILYHYDVLSRGEAFTFALMIGISLLMLITIIFTFINKKAMLSKYSMAVKAEVIDLLKNPNTNREFYQPIYQYTIDDEVYTVGALSYINKNIPSIGEKITLYVDPKDHEGVYFEKDKTTAIQDLVILVILMLVSLGIGIAMFF